MNYSETEYKFTRVKNYYQVTKNGIFYGNYDTIQEARDDIEKDEDFLSASESACNNS